MDASPYIHLFCKEADNLGDFLCATMGDKIQNGIYTYRHDFAPRGANGGVASHENIPTLLKRMGWSGGAKVLGHPTIWILVGQRPIALAESAGGGCLDIFFSLSFLSSFSLSLGDGPI